MECGSGRPPRPRRVGAYQRRGRFLRSDWFELELDELFELELDELLSLQFDELFEELLLELLFELFELEFDELLLLEFEALLLLELEELLPHHASCTGASPTASAAGCAGCDVRGVGMAIAGAAAIAPAHMTVNFTVDMTCSIHGGARQEMPAPGCSDGYVAAIASRPRFYCRDGREDRSIH